jgi:hypothetical protein
MNSKSNNGQSASRLIINKPTENEIELKTVAGRVQPNIGTALPRFKQNEPYSVEFQTKMPATY